MRKQEDTQGAARAAAPKGEPMDATLSALCVRGVEEGVFPGAAAAVAVRRDGRWTRTFAVAGRTRLDDAARSVHQSTRFDLASLTKPLCTALGLFILAGRERLDLEARATDLPGFRDLPPHWREMRITDLLCHASGLPGYREFYKGFAPERSPENRPRLFDLVASEAPASARGTRAEYSDLGFLMLGWMLETLAGQPLDVFFRENVASPLGLAEEIGFRPLPASDGAEDIAATEDCPWRGRIMQGEVHDHHAWLLDGVAGHAGLFGTVGAVTELCTALVDLWHGRPGHPRLDAGIVRRALDFRAPAGIWALGLDRPTKGASSSGDLFLPSSVGHLGFTGTSFWLDLEREIVVVLLTNRVHPQAENRRIQEFRPWFHNKVMEKLVGG